MEFSGIPQEADVFQESLDIAPYTVYGCSKRRDATILLCSDEDDRDKLQLKSDGTFSYTMTTGVNVGMDQDQEAIYVEGTYSFTSPQNITLDLTSCTKLVNGSPWGDVNSSYLLQIKGKDPREIRTQQAELRFDGVWVISPSNADWTCQQNGNGVTGVMD